MPCDNEVPCDDEVEVGDEDEVVDELERAAVNEVEHSNFTVEDTEKRLEVGEIVENEYIAYGLYCKYAREIGFSIFVCSYEGKKDTKRSKSKINVYQKPTIRCNCEAKLRIARRKDDVWRVTTFKKDHNHDMFAPYQRHLLRSARKLSDEQELLISTMVQSKIPVMRAYDMLENMAGGRENVGFTPRDAYDALYRAQKTKMKNEDASELVKHFMDKSNNEPFFYWNIEVDDDNRLMNFFFRDYRCMVDYEHFGDVVSFDTTYKTNKYELICAPFIGIDNHNQNVMFGLAFLSDETESSFEWLFRTFLESMGGKQPETIFTDQCQAMMNAIGTVFPKAYHRLCQWHINRNAVSHFGSLKENKKFKYLWNKCMSYCQTEEEFEETWQKMMDNYNLNGQKWFQRCTSCDIDGFLL
ncbi:hypothetical protein ACJIZ3_003593 [Penstemon smallii]|uniref:Protein FAR1-RELATED SEQUENCE n=1 Tax=Penstemon smallii TaxID=265156 RepID=A0ABD3UCR4_9LAMI